VNRSRCAVDCNCRQTVDFGISVRRGQWCRHTVQHNGPVSTALKFRLGARESEIVQVAREGRYFIRSFFTQTLNANRTLFLGRRQFCRLAVHLVLTARYLYPDSADSALSEPLCYMNDRQYTQLTTSKIFIKFYMTNAKRRFHEATAGWSKKYATDKLSTNFTILWYSLIVVESGSEVKFFCQIKC